LTTTANETPTNSSNGKGTALRLVRLHLIFNNYWMTTWAKVGKNWIECKKPSMLRGPLKPL
jgi:hypothetical protein